MTKKKKPAKLVKRTAVLKKPAVVKDDPLVTKKLAAQAKKLAKQQKIVAAADATKTKAKLVKTTSKKSNYMAPAPVVDDDAPHIDCRMMINGVGYPVDPSSLEHTIGAGEWGHGRGLVDAWPEAAWVGLLAHLGLPADPLDPEVAGQPVKRLVQRLWYEVVKGEVPSREVFAKRDEERQEEYKEKFEGVKAAVVEKKVRAQKAFANVNHSQSTDDRAIVVVAKSNPYKEGTKAFKTFALFAEAGTVSKFLDLARADKANFEAGYLRYSSRDGYIKIQ